MVTVEFRKYIKSAIGYQTHIGESDSYFQLKGTVTANYNSFLEIFDGA